MDNDEQRDYQEERWNAETPEREEGMPLMTAATIHPRYAFTTSDGDSIVIEQWGDSDLWRAFLVDGDSMQQFGVLNSAWVLANVLSRTWVLA